MLNYAAVQNLLDQSVGPGPVGAHHAFWRGITRDQFVSLEIFGYPLISDNDSAGSNLLKALRGEAPFGVDLGTPGATMPQMPAYLPAMGAEDINAIAEWVDNGCPE